MPAFPQVKTAASKQCGIFVTAAEAAEAGYRPCKRCRPDLVDYRPFLDMAEKMKKVIDVYYNERNILSEQLGKISVTQHRMVEIFREQYNVTPSEHADGLRIGAAKEKLASSNGIYHQYRAVFGI